MSCPCWRHPFRLSPTGTVKDTTLNFIEDFCPLRVHQHPLNGHLNLGNANGSSIYRVFLSFPLPILIL
jgi:hypothetical protein